MTLSDRELLAKTLQAEAGNQGIGGMLAVGSVIRNRMAQGGSLSDVILAPAQFSAWNKVTGAVGGEQGQDMAAIKPSEDAYAAADAILSGNAPDVTGGATHYYNPSISNPAWGKEKAGGDWTKIGAHIFGKAGDFRTGAAKMNGEQTQKPQGLLGGLLGGQGIGGALGMSDDFRDKLKMAILAGTGDARMDPLIRATAARMEERRGEQKLQGQINKTEKFLRNKGRDDLADAMLTGAIDPSSAITAAVKPVASTAFEAKFNIYKKAMPEATDQEVLAAMEGGPDTPAAIRELEIRAERAGLVAGTPEYKKFFETSGLAQEAAAKATGKAGGEAAVQAAGAKKDVDFAIQLVDDLLNDPALDKVVGPLEGALPNVSADAVRVQAKIDRLSGQAFIAARQMLKGGGQITDFESKRAEAAYSLLMNTRLSDEDYRAALMEFKDAVQAGYNRLMAQAQAGGATGSATSPAAQPIDNDPAGLR
jgi:hypothetical protein